MRACIGFCAIISILSQVDHGYNMNWLSELRQVSVLFINLDPDLSVEVDEGQHLLQTAFEAVYPSLSKFDGRYMYTTNQPRI